MAGGFEHYANHLIKQNLAKLRSRNKDRSTETRFRNDRRLQKDNSTNYDEIRSYMRKKTLNKNRYLWITLVIIAVLIGYVIIYQL